MCVRPAFDMVGWCFYALAIYIYTAARKYDREISKHKRGNTKLNDRETQNGMAFPTFRIGTLALASSNQHRVFAILLC